MISLLDYLARIAAALERIAAASEQQRDDLHAISETVRDTRVAPWEIVAAIRELRREP